jgi:ParB-like chromosome segregation protein Spo0J
VITYGQEKHKNTKTTTIILSSNPNMKSELIPISKVKANPNNPRIIKDEKFKKLIKSIQEFPQMLEIRPIVVNEEMIVLGGNMRLKACQEAGLKEVHIIKASELTE